MIARRNFAGVCGRWYPVILVLHRFFFAISRAVVNHVDGPVLHLILWSGLLVRFPRDVGWCTPCEIGPAGIWDGEWIALASALVTADDVETWPYSVEILVEWVAFLSSLHWPAARADLGVGGVSSVVMLTMYELWACERLVLEKAVHRKR